MMEVEGELGCKFDDVDVDSILARCERRGPLTFSRKRILYHAPEFIKRLPATETVEEGSTVTFGCKVVGFPKPSVTWYKEDDVISADSRAKLDNEDSGIHSIQISDISKCDAGTYKVRASNLEGSSSSSLFITVKAKSKLRNKKKNRRKGKTVACKPLFPAIIELVAEENRETLEVELQPESPLTPIYCTISRKTPVMWPVFLGDWAYSNEELLQRCDLEDMDIGSEDVFDAETDYVPTHNSLTFVSSAYAQVNELQDSDTENDENNSILLTELDSKITENTPNGVSNGDIKDGINICKRPDNLPLNNVSNGISNGRYTRGNSRKELYSGDQNGDMKYLNHENHTNGDLINNNSTDSMYSGCSEGCQRTNAEPNTCPNDPDTISVNRSYARGNSTFSVAKRSPSPYSKSRKLMTSSDINNSLPHGSQFRNGSSYDINDATTLQNLSNERILSRMRQRTWWCSRVWKTFVSCANGTNFDDNLLGIILLLCGSTFLALSLDIAPLSFVINIVVAMIIKLVLSYVLTHT